MTNKTPFEVSVREMDRLIAWQRDLADKLRHVSDRTGWRREHDECTTAFEVWAAARRAMDTQTTLSHLAAILRQIDLSSIGVPADVLDRTRFLELVRQQRDRLLRRVERSFSD